MNMIDNAGTKQCFPRMLNIAPDEVRGVIRMIMQRLRKRFRGRPKSLPAAPVDIRMKITRKKLERERPAVVPAEEFARKPLPEVQMINRSNVRAKILDPDYVRGSSSSPRRFV